MNRVKRIAAMLLCAFTTFAVQAQDTTADANDTMRSYGKIYVVVAVVVTILFGLFVYVFMLDRKISKMEKK